MSMIYATLEAGHPFSARMLAALESALAPGRFGFERDATKLVNDAVQSVREYWRDGGALVERGSGAWFRRADGRRLQCPDQVRVYVGSAHLMTINDPWR